MRGKEKLYSIGNESVGIHQTHIEIERNPFPQNHSLILSFFLLRTYGITESITVVKIYLFVYLYKF